MLNVVLTSNNFHKIYNSLLVLLWAHILPNFWTLLRYHLSRLPNPIFFLILLLFNNIRYTLSSCLLLLKFLTPLLTLFHFTPNEIQHVSLKVYIRHEYFEDRFSWLELNVQGYWFVNIFCLYTQKLNTPLQDSHLYLYIVIILATQLIYHLNPHYYHVLISTPNHFSLLTIAVFAIT